MQDGLTQRGHVLRRGEDQVEAVAEALPGTGNITANPVTLSVSEGSRQGYGVHVGTLRCAQRDRGCGGDGGCQEIANQGTKQPPPPLALLGLSLLQRVAHGHQRVHAGDDAALLGERRDGDEKTRNALLIKSASLYCILRITLNSKNGQETQKIRL